MRKDTYFKLLALCQLAALIQGWIVLKVYAAWVLILLYLGITGAIPFLMLNGVHGGMEGVAGVIGGILYVLINGFVYSGAVVLLLRLKGRSKRAGLSPSR
jgi:hypothetical protein